MKYSGTIISESLSDPKILDSLKIISSRVTDDENPQDRWHLYSVEVSEKEIELISKNLESTKWYAHFWQGNKIIAVFKDKTFTFLKDKKGTWKPAIDYGLSIGIPKQQLDFKIK